MEFSLNKIINECILCNDICVQSMRWYVVGADYSGAGSLVNVIKTFNEIDILNKKKFVNLSGEQCSIKLSIEDSSYEYTSTNYPKLIGSPLFLQYDCKCNYRAFFGIYFDSKINKFNIKLEHEIALISTVNYEENGNHKYDIGKFNTMSSHHRNEKCTILSETYSYPCHESSKQTEVFYLYPYKCMDNLAKKAEELIASGNLRQINSDSI